MSVPPFTPLGDLGLPPLPPGWSEHIGPGGQIYFYNAHSQESTYVRPIPVFPIISTIEAESKKKKEKPLVKTPIPGTDWLRVKTTEGNVFYTNKVKKESLWTVPEEIKDAVEALEKVELNGPESANEGAIPTKERELQEIAHGKAEKIHGEIQEILKRKADDIIPIDEVVITKKAKVEEEESQNQDGEDSEESEEEDWQREAAVQLAIEAEAERKRLEEEAERDKRDSEAEAKRTQAAQIMMPERVDLSLEEAKALFKTLLREKDINPLHPWDASLPKFVSDPRYVLLPSVAARREAFDDYCRDRARELRQSVVMKEKDPTNPKGEFERLLHEEVKSTRITWNDFRRTWKKDRRFYGWGRDDRERQKRFRDFIRELGEKKRASAKKAEVDFFVLLREYGDIKEGSAWKDVKQKLFDDPRYDAVGSSSLREELYNTFLKGNQPVPIFKEERPVQEARQNDDDELDDFDENGKQQRRKERKEKAVKEREMQVKAERDRLEMDIGRSRMGIHKEEGEREFKSLLTDAVWDPQVTWDTALPQLKTDPRLENSPLPLNQQLRLFHIHVGHLRTKHIDSLHALFESYAPSLATTFDALPLSSLLISIPVTKLGFDMESLEHEFEKWQRERTHESRKAFDDMLAENSFVEFWGRLRKIGGEGVDGGVKADEIEEDEGEGGGGKVDMKALAKNVDVRDVGKVLKNDKRYIMFDHVPEQRERWIRDYLSNLSAPKLSVHLQQASS